MKKIILGSLFTCLIVSISFSQNLKVSKTKISIESGENQTTTAVVKIKNTSDKEVFFKSYIKGQDVYFSKEDRSDWRMSVNQDSISPSTSITRENKKSFFNIIREQDHAKDRSPMGTVWAIGKTADLQNSDYSLFRYAIRSPKAYIDSTLSLYLKRENRHFDVVIKSFAKGEDAGGFSYIRTEINPDWLVCNLTNSSIKKNGTSQLIVTLDTSLIQPGRYAATLVITDTDTMSKIDIPIDIIVAK